MPNEEPIATKRGFQRYTDSLASTKQLKHLKHVHDAMTPIFRLMGTGMTLTQADKCILMESQHMPPAEKQGKCRVLRLTQQWFVKIVGFVCSAIGIEIVIVNTFKLRQYFVTVAMKAGAGTEEAGAGGDSSMVDAWDDIHHPARM